MWRHPSTGDFLANVLLAWYSGACDAELLVLRILQIWQWHITSIFEWSRQNTSAVTVCCTVVCLSNFHLPCYPKKRDHLSRGSTICMAFLVCVGVGQVKDQVLAGRLLKAYLNRKGRFAPVLATIPLYLVLDTNLGVRGTIAYAAQLSSQEKLAA